MPETMTMEKTKTSADIKNLLKQLENDHRKANISDKTYKELKTKYKSDLLYLENTIGDAPQTATQTASQPTVAVKKEEPKKEEVPKEGTESIEVGNTETQNMEQPPEQATTKQTTQIEEKEKKPGLFGKLFGKKKEGQEKSQAQEVQEMPQTQEVQETSQTQEVQETEEAAQPETQNESKDNSSLLVIEIEKLKVMLDAMREQKNAADDSIRNIFESIGEIRSMILQNDATTSTIGNKLEKLEDDVGQVRPKEIDKKFKDMNEKLEKYDLTIEKMQTKASDMTEKMNTATELLKNIGGVENLAKIDEEVQKKLDDIKEAIRYIERLGSKSERMFLDVRAGLDDLVVYKARQEAVEENIKEIMKNIDSLSSKLETYATKKDSESQSAAITLVQKEIENINKSLGIVQSSMPEKIMRMRKQREDIAIFLESLESQFKEGKIGMEDYAHIKEKNIARMKELEDAIDKEWKLLETIASHKSDIMEEERLKMRPFVIVQDYQTGKKRKIKKLEYDTELSEENYDILRGNKVDVNFFLPPTDVEQNEPIQTEQSPEQNTAAAPQTATAETGQKKEETKQEEEKNIGGFLSKLLHKETEKGETKKEEKNNEKK